MGHLLTKKSNLFLKLSFIDQQVDLLIKAPSLLAKQKSSLNRSEQALYYIYPDEAHLLFFFFKHHSNLASIQQLSNNITNIRVLTINSSNTLITETSIFSHNNVFDREQACHRVGDNSHRAEDNSHRVADNSK